MIWYHVIGFPKIWNRLVRIIISYIIVIDVNDLINKLMISLIWQHLIKFY